MMLVQLVCHKPLPQRWMSFEHALSLSTDSRRGDDGDGTQNGLTLTKLEQSGLLSKAEELGLLGFAETLLTTDPGLITAASIPPLSAAVGTSTLTDSP